METGLKINPETLQEYQKRLAAQFKERPASLNRKLSSLRQFAKWAGNKGYLVKTPPSHSPRHLGKVIVLLIIILAILGLSRFITISELPVLKVAEPQTAIASFSPWIIHFQGKLSSTNGQPAQESAKVVFKLYKEEKDGPPLWTSKTWPLEPNPQGEFTAPVGDTTRGDYELPSNYFFQEKKLFLGVEVNGEQIPERMRVSTADAAANSYLLQNYPPDLEAGPLTIPVINEDGALVLAAQNPSIKAVSGTLGISADSLSLITPDASDGSITLNPDGKGVVNLLFEGKAPIGGDGFLNAKNANQTSGALIYGEVANNATGYRLIELVSGSTPTTRFSVDGSGNTFVAGQLTAQSGQLTNDLNLVSGNLKTSGVIRLTNAGRLSSIGGYYQDSGEFRIDQGAPDIAKITKSGVTASADSLTITMDETPPVGGASLTASNYDTLVLKRQGGGPTAYALYLAAGNALFEGTLEVKKGLTANENLDVKGDTTLGDATTDKITFNAQIASSLIPTTDSAYDLGSSTKYWNNIYVNNLYGGGSGILGFWQRNNGALSPSKITDDLLLGAIATSSALVKLTGTAGNNSWINTGNFGVGTTNPSALFSVGSTSQFQINSSGAIAAAGITSSGTITFSGLATNGPVYTTTGGVLNSEQYLDLTRGGTDADLSGVSQGGLIYKEASALAGTGALSGILQGNGSSAPSAITGTANYLPKWASSAPYLTATSLIYDDGTNVGIGKTNPAYKLDVNGSLGVGGTAWFGSNVGIGTTAPGSALQVNGNITPGTTDQDLGTTSLRWDLLANTINADSTVTLTGLGTGVDNTVLILDTSNNVTTDEIDARVWGTSLVDFSGTGNANYLAKFSDDETILKSVMYETGSQIGIGKTNPGYQLDLSSSLGVGGTAYFASNVGIGNTSPTQRLDITGNATLSGTLALGPNAPAYAGTCNAGNAGKQYFDGTDSKMYYCNGTAWVIMGLTSSVSGAGTTNYLPLWTGATTLANSSLYETGSQIGVGLTNPSYKLEINGSLGIGGTAWFGSNVGIGTTAPGSALQVNGNITPGTTDQDLGTTALRWDLLANTINADSTVTLTGLGTGTDNTVLILDGSNNVTTDEIDSRVWGTTLVDYSGTLANYLPKMSDADTLANSIMYETGSQIGVGKTNPGYQLDLSGSLGVGSTAYFASNVGIGTSAPTQALDLSGSSANFTFSSATGPHQVLTGGSTHLALMPGGSVGIGTTSPTAALDIAGDASTSASLVFRASSPTIDILNNASLVFQSSVGGDAGLGTITTLSPAGNLTLVGDLAVNGDDITADGDLNINPSGGQVTFTDAVTLNVGGKTGLAYNAFANSADAPEEAGIADDNDLYLGGNLEVDGTIYGNVSGTITPSGFTQGSVIFAGSGGTLTQDNANFFWDDTNNRLGIGTTAPLTALDIAGSASSSGTLTFRGTTDPKINVLNGENLGIQTSVGGDAGLSERFTITNAGNVGIGTTGPSYNLDVSGTAIRLNAPVGIQRTPDTNYALVVQGQEYHSSGTVHFTDAVNMNNALIHNIGHANTDFTSGGGLNVEGNVGIGTTGPAYKLDVNGSLGIGGTAYFASNVGIGTSAPTQALDLSGSSANFTFSSTTGPHQVLTGGSTHLALMPGGSVGVGTTSPSYKLDINGTLGVGSTAWFGSLVGLGTTAPGGIGGVCCIRLEIADENGSKSDILHRVAGGSYPIYNFASSNGTLAAPTISANGNNLGQIDFNGYDGTSYLIGAEIAAQIDGTPGTNDMPGRLIFFTTADGTTTLSERMRIDNRGNVGIGSTSPEAKLTINGTTTGKALSIFNETGANDILVASASGAARFVVKNDGTLKAARFEDEIGGSATGYFLDPAATGNSLITAGSVGIATTNPGYKLEVNGSLGVGGTAWFGSNVGIGTTAPGYKLTVNGTPELLSINPDAYNTLLVYEDMKGTTVNNGTLKNSATFDSTNDYVVLTTATNSIKGQLEYSMNPGNSFAADFEFWTGGGNGADAMWLYTFNTSTPNDEDAASGGYIVAYDEYNNQVQLKYNGTTLATYSVNDLDNSAWRKARIVFFRNNFRIYLDAAVVINYQDTNRSLTGGLFGWGARTGGSNNEHRIRNLAVYKYTGSEWAYSSFTDTEVYTSGNVGIGATSANYKLNVNGSLGVGGTAWFGSNVGIGTTSPSESLDIIGNVEIDDNDTSGKGIILESADRPLITRGWDAFTSGTYNGIGRWGMFMESNTLTFGIANTATRYFKFRAFNADSTANDLMTIRYDGNVGIGTTDPSAAKLVIDSGSNTAGIRLLGTAETTEIGDIYVGSTGQLVLSTAATGDTSPYIEVDAEDDQYGFIIRDSSTGSTQWANLYMNDAATDYLNIVVNATNATAGLVIDDNDNVGIGTTSPGYKLDINGSLGVGGTAWFGSRVGIGTTAPTATLDIVGDASSSGSLVLRGTSPATIDVLNGDRFDIQTSVGGDVGLTPRLTVLNGGNVGIGNTNPSYKLDVNGTLGVGGTAYFASNVGVGTTAPTYQLQTTGSLGVGGTAWFGSNVGIGTTSPQRKLDVSSSGQITFGDDVVTDASQGIYWYSSTEYAIYRKPGAWVQPLNFNFITGIAFDAGIYPITMTAQQLAITASATTGHALQVTANSLTSGNALNVSSNSTAALTGDALANLAVSGANAASSITRYALYATNTATGTTSTNVGGYFSASGATNNYGLIVENGNVGIGTTGPAYKLDVNGSLGVGGTAWFGSNVGIGTTNPGAKLTFADTVEEKIRLYGTTYGIGVSGYTMDIYADRLVKFRDNSYAGTVNAQIAVETGYDTYFNAGNVGIGTTSPSYKLDVNGSLGVGGTAWFGSNVGIGTTRPGAKLHVAGTGFFSGDVSVASQSAIAAQPYNMNIAPNASFEVNTDTTDADANDNWTRIQVGATTVNRVSTDSSQGAYSIEIAITGAYPTNYGYLTSTRFPISPSTSYTASVDVKGNYTLGMYLRLLWLDQWGNYLNYSDAQANVTTTASWATYTGSVTSPANAYYAQIRLFNISTDSTRYFDNVSLRRTSFDGNINFAINTGNVGIGTTSPGYKLEVNGTLGVGSTAYFTSTVGIGSTNPGANTVKIVGSLCVKSTDAACAGSTAGTIYATNTTVQSADVAELYPSSENLEPGTVVSPDQSGPAAIQQSKTPYQNLLGVISTEPGVLLSSDVLTDPAHPYALPVALVGRVPTKVGLKNGPIAIGDPLTSSSIPGVAMRATKAGAIVGKALESFDGNTSDGKIMVFVNVSWYDPDVYLTDSGDLKITKLEVRGETLDNEVGSATESTNLTSHFNNLASHFALLTSTGEVIERIGAFSEAAVANLRAGLIEAQELIADNITTNNLTINNKLVSPVIETDEIGIRNQELGIRNKDGEMVMKIDNEGKTTHFGDLLVNGQIQSSNITTNNLTIENDATISGTLYAEEIVTKQGKFGDLIANQIEAATVSAQYITYVNNIYQTTYPPSSQEDFGEASNIVQAEPIPTTTPTPALTASDAVTPTPTPTPTFDLSQPVASESSLLTDSQNWQLSNPSGDLKITSDVRITGKTNLAQTIIAGPLSQDGSLIIDQGNSINVTTDTLYLQNLGFGGVDILAGKMVIDVNGNVQIAGNLAVGGNLSAATLHLGGVPSATSEVTGTGSSDGESGFGKLLEIQNPLGETVASIDASGSASFASVQAQKLIIAAPTSPDTPASLTSPEIQTNATAGEAILPAGATEITINSQFVTDNTLIYITPVSNTQNKVLYVSAKKTEEFFKVAIDTPIESEIKFNWWIIN